MAERPAAGARSKMKNSAPPSPTTSPASAGCSSVPVRVRPCSSVFSPKKPQKPRRNRPNGQKNTKIHPKPPNSPSFSPKPPNSHPFSTKNPTIPPQPVRSRLSRFSGIPALSVNRLSAPVPVPSVPSVPFVPFPPLPSGIFPPFRGIFMPFGLFSGLFWPVFLKNPASAAQFAPSPGSPPPDSRFWRAWRRQFRRW